MKKILILGAGVQGTAVARELALEPTVEKIILASRNEKYVKELAEELDKTEGIYCNADDYEQVREAIKGCDLVVNALPVTYGKTVLDAALEEGADYQDFAGCEDLGDTWMESMGRLFSEYSKKFADRGNLALVGTGSTPGLMCVVARDTVKHVDKCDDITMFVYEGVEAKRFQPFWWSPEVALEDMFNAPIATINGEIVNTEPYSLPIERKFEYMDYPVRLVEHAHEEPFFMGLNKDTLFKGAKNIHFKYGGVGVEFSEPLYKAGKLSMEPDENGVVPRLEVLKTIPRPPKEPAVLQEILDEGLVRDDGAFGCEIIGEKDGRKIKVETHVFAPGLAESFEKLQMSAEQYITGLSGFMFTRMLVRDEIKQTGLISTDMLSEEENRIYMAYENAIGIYAETTEEYLD